MGPFILLSPTIQKAPGYHWASYRSLKRYLYIEVLQNTQEPEDEWHGKILDPKTLKLETLEPTASPRILIECSFCAM